VKTEHDVVVVGGGVIGVSCAYFLAKRGARVTVLERDEIGHGASFGNAGTIAPGHGPINKPGRVSQALRSLFDPLSPLFVAPRWDPGLARWLLAFSRSCTPRAWHHALRSLAPLGHATVDLFDRIIAEERLECGYERDGYHEVYLTDEAFGEAWEEAELTRPHGFEPERVEADALRERLPALTDRIRGGVFYPEAMTLDPFAFVTGLARCAERHGAAIRIGTSVTEVVTAASAVRGVRLDTGETVGATTVILATGAYSLELSRSLGVRLPLQPAKGYHRDLPNLTGVPPALGGTCMLGEASVFCTPMPGRLRFAGTLEFSGENHDLRRPRLDQLTSAAHRYFTDFEDVTASSEWCGLRPCLPDGLPAIGPIDRHPDVFVATGHAMLGLTLGPVTGRLVAESVLDGRPSIDLSAFRIGRFA
jgi:D-amino-acid dehydrogenase